VPRHDMIRSILVDKVAPLCEGKHMEQKGNEGARLLAACVKEMGSQAKAARRSGIDPAHISRYLRGDRLPGLEHAVLMAVELGVPVSSWLSHITDETENEK